MRYTVTVDLEIDVTLAERISFDKEYKSAPGFLNPADAMEDVCHNAVESFLAEGYGTLLCTRSGWEG